MSDIWKKKEKWLIIIISIIIISIFTGDRIYNSFDKNDKNDKNKIEIIDSLSIKVQNTVEDVEDVIKNNLENKLKRDSLKKLLTETSIDDKNRINGLKKEIYSLDSEKNIISSNNSTCFDSLNLIIDDKNSIILDQKIQIEKLENKFNDLMIKSLDTNNNFLTPIDSIEIIDKLLILLF